MNDKARRALVKSHLNIAIELLEPARDHLQWAAKNGADLDLEMESIDSLLRLVRIEAEKTKGGTE